jgi:signal transduction histidine kinase/CheY-like chemotaxis protein/HPt (histidine-containing phosphotransfer) domain-containing protein
MHNNVPMLDGIRAKATKLFVWLIWAHVLVAALVAIIARNPWQVPVAIALVTALVAALASWKLSDGITLRSIMTVCLTIGPIIFVYAGRGATSGISGHGAWQVDYHMYFFCVFAILTAYIDWRPIAIAAVLTAGHHLILDLIVPASVFPEEGLDRVLLHAITVVAECGALIWLTIAINDLFGRLHVATDLVDVTARDSAEVVRASQTVEIALRQATEASRLKSEFVATMSHEIRTPMNGVMGTTELLLRTELNQQQHGYALTIRESGDALLRVINDILDFSKMEAGKMDLDIAEFDIVLVVESVASLLMPQARKKRLSLMTFIDPAIPARLIGDADRLRQVLLNLAGNAIKFTEAGNVLISATLKPSSAKRVRIEFSVSDTGMGLTPESQAWLFEPFHQLDGSSSRKHGGTGLGLSISQQLVHLMGGSISVQSALGKGAVFSFRVVLAVTSAETRERLVPSQSPHILIISDDLVSRDVISQYVGGWNMTCEIAINSRAVLPRLDRAFKNGKPFDLAIVDLATPRTDAFALAEKIRDDGRFSAMRLLLVTADDKPEPTGTGHTVFSAYLVKPLKQSHLYDCIVDALVVPISPELRAEGALEPPPTSDLLILVAEDNSINRQLALQQLEILGYAAIAVENGKKAVESAAKFDYDVILMDCQMPEMDGYDATRAIRRLEARTGKRCRIIAMTATLSSDHIRCTAAGMDDYISKPVTLERLQEALQATAAPGTHDAADAAGDGERSEVLNLPRLQQIFSDRTAIGPFLQSALPVLSEMVQRLASCATCDEGAAVVHELKGAAANLGAAALSSAAASLEREILAGNMDAAGIANTKKALDELADAIGRYECIPA